MTDPADAQRCTSALDAQTPAALAAARILALIDDEALQFATELLLKMERYRVISASALPQAVRVAQAASGITILLMCEPLAGEVTAGEAIACLRRIVGPQLKVLVLTGHLSPSLRGLEHQGLARIAMMPVAADALLSELRSIQDSAGNTSAPGAERR